MPTARSATGRPLEPYVVVERTTPWGTTKEAAVEYVPSCRGVAGPMIFTAEGGIVRCSSLVGDAPAILLEASRPTPFLLETYLDNGPAEADLEVAHWASELRIPFAQGLGVRRYVLTRGDGWVTDDGEVVFPALSEHLDELANRAGLFDV